MYSKLQDGSYIISGYVARDAECRTTQNGKQFTTWSVAVGKRQGQNGQQETIWTSCQAWEGAAEIAASIRKGDTVLCIGRIKENESNGKKYKNLVCEFISVMGKAPTPSGATLTDLGSMDDFEEILSDGDVPF